MCDEAALKLLFACLVIPLMLMFASARICVVMLNCKVLNFIFRFQPRYVLDIIRTRADDA